MKNEANDWDVEKKKRINSKSNQMKSNLPTPENMEFVAKKSGISIDSKRN